jgi:hypothetical protein
MGKVPKVTLMIQCRVDGIWKKLPAPMSANGRPKNVPGATFYLYGMPILDVDKARTVMVIKRSVSPGFAGIDNPLYYLDKTLMLFGDAKAFVGDIVRELGGGGHS